MPWSVEHGHSHNGGRLPQAKMPHLSELQKQLVEHWQRAAGRGQRAGGASAGQSACGMRHAG